MTDLIDEMDERLRAVAQQWRAEQPPAPGVPLDRLDMPLHDPRRWRAVVAAAAAVVVIGGTATAVARSHDSPRPQPGGTTGTPTTQVTPHHNPLAIDVPWRALPAGHPDVRHREHGQVVTPFDRVSATGHISGHVRPGDTLVFTAVLESSTDLPLDPCPDFDIAFGTSGSYQHRLNCARVPYRDDQGRPMLPAFTNVGFEMRVTVPDVRGKQKVLWTLDGPQQMPGFYGIVRVTAH